MDTPNTMNDDADLPPCYEAAQADPDLSQMEATYATPISPISSIDLSLIITLHHHTPGAPSAHDGWKTFGACITRQNIFLLLSPTCSWIELNSLLGGRACDEFAGGVEDGIESWELVFMRVGDEEIVVRDAEGWEAARPWLFRGGKLEYRFAYEEAPGKVACEELHFCTCRGLVDLEAQQHCTCSLQ